MSVCRAAFFLFFFLFSSFFYKEINMNTMGGGIWTQYLTVQLSKQFVHLIHRQICCLFHSSFFFSKGIWFFYEETSNVFAFGFSPLTELKLKKKKETKKTKKKSPTPCLENRLLLTLTQKRQRKPVKSKHIYINNIFTLINIYLYILYIMFLALYYTASGVSPWILKHKPEAG